MTKNTHNIRIAVIGGGPAGLMACEALVHQGINVDLYDAMPSLGRKFLMAGKSGLNLTHGEPFADFVGKFGQAQPSLEPALNAFTPTDIQAWASGLSIETFVGSSKRVFPKDFKAAPLLRSWLRKLRANGLTVHARHEWCGWDADGNLVFASPKGHTIVQAERVILALGGASWPKLGSNAHWVPLLNQRGVDITPLKPSNCGFDVDWSDHFIERYEGCPVKNITLQFGGERLSGEFIITKTGIEGGPVYGLSSRLLNTIEDTGTATMGIDLLPDRTGADVQQRIARPRGKKSMSTHLKKALNLTGVKTGLLHECLDKTAFSDQIHLATQIKALPLKLNRPRPIDEAISTSGGVAWYAMDGQFQLKTIPHTYVCGEMMDWDAPTGGYLLSACMATGRWVGAAVANDLSENA